ncbi:hypothetical protein WMY93_012397 [Mugilogobius chulae]|uniref:Uncharacterized protein n=1 Tax=Mugilogobius chulae TaxID=88201 RepID=A0AAW0PGN7_9GOBI
MALAVYVPFPEDDSNSTNHDLCLKLVVLPFHSPVLCCCEVGCRPMQYNSSAKVVTRSQCLPPAHCWRVLWPDISCTEAREAALASVTDDHSEEAGYEWKGSAESVRAF